MAFGNCTDGGSWSKGRQNLESVRLTVYEKQYFTPILTCSNLVKTFHNCSHLFSSAHTYSYLFTLVHAFSKLFTPVHTLVTVHAVAQWQFLVEFSPCESYYFSILHVILLKLHIFAHLMESYPTGSGLCGWIEKKYTVPSGSPYYSDQVRSLRNVIFALSNPLILQS